MTQNRFAVAEEWSVRAHVDAARYREMSAQALADPAEFWAQQARTRLQWMRPFERVKECCFTPPVSIAWFPDGILNVSVNCLDRHVQAGHGERIAFLWESDAGDEVRCISYRECLAHVCRLANVLKNLGIRRGDRVTIYMPMIPEAAFAMLACARIGAMHSVVFGGFSPEALAGRIQDCESSVVITADEGLRGGKTIPLKANVDEALQHCPSVRNVLVVRRTGAAVHWDDARDRWYHEEVEHATDECAPEPMEAEAPLFLLYTSGSTGKPKGLVHTTAGYLLHAAMTHELIFDYRPGDIYWCTADVGWITGHSYVVYGPLANGATSLIFEGVPHFPTPARHWEIVDRHGVNIYYTAPTAIRALMREGDQHLSGTSRATLRLLGTVGEPINPEAWLWYHRVVGNGRCPIVDTWWQTETGGILIAPLPGAIALKPGSATLPFFGIRPSIVDADGRELQGACEGNLCLCDSWPGQARTVYGDHQRFEQTYFSAYPGKYFTGDGCRRDEDGYYWITGRVDDVINVAGHRLGTAEIESALVGHEKVSEAAVVGFPHDIKGQGIYAYVTLKVDAVPSEALRSELVQWVRKAISPIATPDKIQWAKQLPKTRSGKIMRRILRKIAAGDVEHLGDVSTLADPDCVRELLVHRQ